MRFLTNLQSSQKEARDVYDTSDPQVVKESCIGQSDDRVNVTPRHTNKKPFSDEEGRQDADMENERLQQHVDDDFEFDLLYKEIERIDHSFQSGSNESEETISLTSTYNNDALISRSMHCKLMRLIKAMIPNSTSGQKESFIKDLFEMGIRASRNSPTRMQYLERESQLRNQTTPTDDLMIEESNSIIESSVDNESAEEKDQIQQRPNDAIPVYHPYFGGNPENVHPLDEYVDEENSIIASMDEGDIPPDVEMATSVHQSTSSRRYIDSIAATSSDAVDIRWDHLRNKVLNSSNSNSERTSSLTSAMEENLIRECVETGLTSSKSHQVQDGFNGASRRQDTATQKKEDQRLFGSDGSSSIREPASDMRGMKIGEHSGSKRPGQADDTGIDQPPMQQRNTDSDSFSIDAMSNSIIQDGSTGTSNAPSFDEAPMDEREGSSLGCGDLINSRENSVQATESAGNVENGQSNRSQRTHEITLHPSLKNELTLRVSNSIDVEKKGTSSVESKSDSTILSDGGSIEDSSRNVSKLFNVKSSLTFGTDIPMPNREPDRSFYQIVDLSTSEAFENQESPDLTDDLQPSWRLSPAASLSDFMLTVSNSETAATTNYYIHKHMMAIGPRSSQYMNEVFAAENTPNFEVTLDEKTSSLIPKILDYIYCEEHDVIVTTDNAVALRQLAKMFKIVPLEIKAVRFLLEDMRIENMVTYVSDCCYFDDIEVTKAVVEKCTANIGSISMSDRLWVVMEPALFLQLVSSSQIDRRARSKHLSILLREYLDLHQYEITVEMFVTLTSDSIIPIVDRSVALPLIELSDNYHSKECEGLQKRCAFTIACYWQTTPQAERHRLFALLRNLPSSLTVDFLEVVESGRVTLEMLRSEMEEEGSIGNVNNIDEKEVMAFEDFSIGSIGDRNEEELSWRMDPEKSYSDMIIRVNYLNHDGFQIYHVHKHIIGTGAKNSAFIIQNLNSTEISVGEKICVVIELDYEGAALVPQVLDFMYPRHSELEISNENAVAFHYVARAFGIQALSKKITEFIEQNILLENVSDYIVEGGYYRDHIVLATAGRLCAQEIRSIDVESKLLEELEPDFFGMIVSCDAIDRSARSHVNVLITKYFSVRSNLEDDVIEKLIKSIRIDQIEKYTALNLLEMITKIKKEYEGIETFESMKKKSVEVLTQNWVELTVNDNRREELFAILPLFTPALLTSMFKAIDTKNRMEREEAISQQVKTEKRFKEEIAESNRLRDEEVSYLRNELEVRTVKMLRLQKQLEGKLIQVDKTLVRRTGRSAAAITTSPARNKINQFSDNKEIMIAASAMSDQYELAKEVEGPWCCPDNGGSSIGGRMMNVEEMEKISEVSEHSYNVNEGESEEKQYKRKSDEHSISSTEIQTRKGGIFC